MKKSELAKCACGGEPKRVRLPNGKQMAKCTGCGKKTKAHGREAEATKEWKRIAGKPVQKGEAAAKPLSEKTAKRIEKGLDAMKKRSAKRPAPESAKAAVAGLAEVSALAKRLSEAADEVGGLVTTILGLDGKEIKEATRIGVERAFNARRAGQATEVKATVIGGEAAKRLVSMLAEAGAVPEAVVAGFCGKPAKKGGK